MVKALLIRVKMPTTGQACFYLLDSPFSLGQRVSPFILATHVCLEIENKYFIIFLGIFLKVIVVEWIGPPKVKQA